MSFGTTLSLSPAMSPSLSPCDEGECRADVPRVSCVSRISHSSRTSEGTLSNTGSAVTVLQDAPPHRSPPLARPPAAFHVHEASCRKEEEVARATAQGRLTDVRVDIEWIHDPNGPLSSAPQLAITAEARCHGWSICCSDRGWRSRHVEVARRLMREFLVVVRQSLDEVSPSIVALRNERLATGSAAGLATGSGSGPPSAGEGSAEEDDEEAETTDDEGESDGPPHGPSVGRTVRGEIAVCEIEDASMGSAATDTIERESLPGVRVVDIEWGGNVRWGGDAAYDVHRDGDILLQGACTMDDPLAQCPYRTRPIWNAHYDPLASCTPHVDRGCVAGGASRYDGTRNAQERPNAVGACRWNGVPPMAVMNAISDAIAAGGHGVVSARRWKIDRLNAGLCYDEEDVDENGAASKPVLSFSIHKTRVRIHG